MQEFTLAVGQDDQRPPQVRFWLAEVHGDIWLNAVHEDEKGRSTCLGKFIAHAGRIDFVPFTIHAPLLCRAFGADMGKPVLARPVRGDPAPAPKGGPGIRISRSDAIGMLDLLDAGAIDDLRLGIESLIEWRKREVDAELAGPFVGGSVYSDVEGDEELAAIYGEDGGPVASIHSSYIIGGSQEQCVAHARRIAALMNAGLAALKAEPQGDVQKQALTWLEKDYPQMMESGATASFSSFAMIDAFTNGWAQRGFVKVELRDEDQFEHDALGEAAEKLLDMAEGTPVDAELCRDIAARLKEIDRNRSATEFGELPRDVIELVIAAREVAFGYWRPLGSDEEGSEAFARLDKASEAFADRVPWDDEPENEEADEDGESEFADSNPARIAMRYYLDMVPPAHRPEGHLDFWNAMIAYCDQPVELPGFNCAGDVRFTLPELGVGLVVATATNLVPPFLGGSTTLHAVAEGSEHITAAWLGPIGAEGDLLWKAVDLANSPSPPVGISINWSYPDDGGEPVPIRSVANEPGEAEE